MNIEVRYYSKGGNTQKIANAIAKAANVEMKTTASPITSKVDLLFLGGALYAGNINKELREFAESLTKDKVKKVIVFSTAAGDKSIHPIIKDILKKHEIPVCDEFFHCRGKFLLANKGRPNEKDLDDASLFTKQIISNEG